MVWYRWQWEALELIRGLKELDIVGYDIAEENKQLKTGKSVSVMKPIFVLVQSQIQNDF